MRCHPIYRRVVKPHSTVCKKSLVDSLGSPVLVKFPIFNQHTSNLVTIIAMSFSLIQTIWIASWSRCCLYITLTSILSRFCHSDCPAGMSLPYFLIEIPQKNHEENGVRNPTVENQTLISARISRWKGSTQDDYEHTTTMQLRDE